MSLAGGDLTTPQRAAEWMANGPSLPNNVIARLVTSCSSMINAKLNRGALYSRSVTTTLDGVGTYQLMLPEYPITEVTQVQMGSQLIQAAPLPTPSTSVVPPANPCYGYRLTTWGGRLPGSPHMLEFVNGIWYYGVQNIKVTYVAGYLVENEPATIAAPTVSGQPPTVTVKMPNGLWCKDNGVAYANGTLFVSVAASPTVGQYVPPTDSAPGVYTFNTNDVNASILISYSFIPADLEEAVCQMVTERYLYRTRVGEISKSLGGQESVRWSRGDLRSAYRDMNALPPEVMDLINPYISVLPPTIGAPV